MWSRLGDQGDRGTNLAVGRNRDGRLEVFLVGMAKDIWHAWETTPGGQWSGWSRLGSPGDKGSVLAVADNSDGRLEVFLIGLDNDVYRNAQTTDGGWSGWSRLAQPSLGTTAMAVGRRSDGRLEVFMSGAPVMLFGNVQGVPGGNFGGSWLNYGPKPGGGHPSAGQLTVGRHPEGRLEPFLIGADQTVWHRAGGSWKMLGSPQDKGTKLAVAENADGRFEVFVIGIARDIWHNWQTTSGGEWSGWNRLGKPDDKGTDLAVGRTAEGHLEAFLVGETGEVKHNWQLAPGGLAWSGWNTLGEPGGKGGATLAVGRNADGTLEAFLLSTTNEVYHAWHMATARIHAIQIANDGGLQPTAITPNQVMQWVDYANKIFQMVRMRFEFIADVNGEDWSNRHSTVLNNLPGGVSSQPADALAKTFPGKIPVLFRSGDPNASGCGVGCGYSGGNWLYILMPGFDTRECQGKPNERQNIGLFAHELGHFFDLGHTFSWVFPTETAAGNWFITMDENPAVFDGDKGIVDDTPPDPLIDPYGCDASRVSVTLSGVIFDLPRDNIMSYYRWDTKTLTIQQIQTVRRKLMARGLGIPRITGSVTIVGILYNPPGRDLPSEHVLIKNHASAAVDMSNWTLKDLANHEFRFPNGFTLRGNSDVRVWTKPGPGGDPSNLYWNKQMPMWNNPGDTAILRNAQGIEVSRFMYA